MKTRSAQSTSSRALHVVAPSAEVSDLLRRERRDKQWTQRQLADFCGVRTQTVSAWERGNTPQRRFFGKIAQFLGLPDEESVEILLLGDSTGSMWPVARQNESTPERTTELRTFVVEAVASQVAGGRTPSPDMIRLLNHLISSVV